MAFVLYFVIHLLLLIIFFADAVKHKCTVMFKKDKRVGVAQPYELRDAIINMHKHNKFYIINSKNNKMYN